MDENNELGRFLEECRARLSPKQVDLPETGARRVRGLRREEVAVLAGKGVDWYTRIEQGRAEGVSAEYLDRIARVLRLTRAKRQHLFHLAGVPLPLSLAPAKEDRELDGALRRIVDMHEVAPVYVLNARLDVLEWNRAAAVVYPDPADFRVQDRNILWLMLTYEPVRRLVVDWEIHAKNMLAMFRAGWGRDTRDQSFSQLIARLKLSSPHFRDWWSDWDHVRLRPAYRKVLDHPKAGTLVFDQVGFPVGPNPELTLVIYAPRSEENTTQKIRELLRTGENDKESRA